MADHTHLGERLVDEFGRNVQPREHGLDLRLQMRLGWVGERRVDVVGRQIDLILDPTVKRPVETSSTGLGRAASERIARERTIHIIHDRGGRAGGASGYFCWPVGGLSSRYGSPAVFRLIPTYGDARRFGSRRPADARWQRPALTRLIGSCRWHRDCGNQSRLDAPHQISGTSYLCVVNRAWRSANRTWLVRARSTLEG